MNNKKIITFINYLEQNKCLKEDKEIYYYSINLLISTFLGTILLFITGYIIDSLILAIIYELSMSSSRIILGGYHCKTHINCIITYVSLFIILIIMTKYFIYSLRLICLIETISLITVSKLCPIENINKKLSPNEKKHFHKYSVIYILILNFFILLLWYINSMYVNFFINLLVILNLSILGGYISYELSKN